MWRQQRRIWERPGKKEGNVRPYPLKIIQTVWHFRIQIVHPTLFCTRGLCWSSWIFFTSLASLYDGRFMPFNQTLSDFVARNATGGRSNIFRNGRFNLQFTVVCIHTLWISCCIILKLRDRGWINLSYAWSIWRGAAYSMRTKSEENLFDWRNVNCKPQKLTEIVYLSCLI